MVQARDIKMKRARSSLPRRLDLFGDGGSGSGDTLPLTRSRSGCILGAFLPPSVLSVRLLNCPMRCMLDRILPSDLGIGTTVFALVWAEDGSVEREDKDGPDLGPGEDQAGSMCW